jgi:hypothetical protein
LYRWAERDFRHEQDGAGTAGRENLSLGREIIERINALAAISEDKANITRIFLTQEHRIAADLILAWMRQAGMTAHMDAIGNVCGRYEDEHPGVPALMLGSHYDTMRDAGRWDGTPGPITAICEVTVRRNSRGLAPLLRLKSRLKCEISRKPAANAISAIVVLRESSRRRVQTRIRWWLTCSPTERPVLEKSLCT